MKIYQLQLQCHKLNEMKKFYSETLQMDLVNATANTFTITAGTTKLIFEKVETVPFYHVAFRCGSKFYSHMTKKLTENNLIIKEEISSFWKGRQCYFYDPEKNVVEMIERKNQETGWFDVGEIGWPSQSVPKMQNTLNQLAKDTINRKSETFAFFGDEDGVFVLVKNGRHWYPTAHPAEVHPIKIVVSGREDARFSHPSLPYQVLVRKEWNKKVPAVQFRIARPTNQIQKIIEFYELGIGLEKIGEFSQHEGYQGVMLGAPDHQYHLEFTQFETPIQLPTPTKEHLLVFYIPDLFERNVIVSRLESMGYRPVEPENPYWSRGGITIEDPDGWRVVLMNTPGISGN